MLKLFSRTWKTTANKYLFTGIRIADDHETRNKSL